MATNPSLQQARLIGQIKSSRAKKKKNEAKKATSDAKRAARDRKKKRAEEREKKQQRIQARRKLELEQLKEEVIVLTQKIHDSKDEIIAQSAEPTKEEEKSRSSPRKGKKSTDNDSSRKGTFKRNKSPNSKDDQHNAANSFEENTLTGTTDTDTAPEQTTGEPENKKIRSWVKHRQHSSVSERKSMYRSTSYQHKSLPQEDVLARYPMIDFG